MGEMPFNLVVGVTCGLSFAWIVFKIRHGSMRQYSLLLLKQAEEKAAVAHHEKTVDLLRQEQALADQKQQVSQLKDRLEKESQRLNTVHEHERSLEIRHKALSEKEHTLERSLEQMSGLSMAETRKELLQRAEASIRPEIDRAILKLSRIIEAEQEIKAQNILLTILERKTLGFTKDSFLESVNLPDRTWVPRFIGKEGRNSKMLSSELDLLVTIEEEPPRILLSSYDPYRRALAKAVVLSLLGSEKITPYTIHNAVIEQTAAFHTHCEAEGQAACRRIGVSAPLSTDILRSIGSMKYRSTAGQNLLLHSIDVAEMMNMAARELGLHSDRAKLMGLLHDIGKILPLSEGVSHAQAGKHFLQRHHIHPDVINGVASHHNEEPQTSLEAKLLPICDTLSAQLAGTRTGQDDHSLLLTRKCEEVASQEAGILSAWAHHAHSHLEVVIHHTTQVNMAHLQHTLETVCGSLPVVIRSMRTDRQPWNYHTRNEA